VSEAPPPPRRRGRSRSAARIRAELIAFRAASAALGALPGRTADSASRALGRWIVGALPRRRRILRSNLAAAFPDAPAEEIERLARGSAEALGRSFAEFLEVAGLSGEEIRRRIQVEGEENLRAARRLGRGVFLLSAHLGGWELGAIRAGMLGEPISPVVRPLDNPLLERELSRRRTRFGNRPIAKRDAARDVLRALKRRETVAILIDQNVLPREAVFVPFFGRLAATTPALARFQIATGAPVVPVFTWPLGDGRYRLGFEPPILADEFRSEGDRAEAVRRATARYMEVTEAAIRKQPAAWLWMHDRWRTRPEDGRG
jgi:Kdo2-lipid IVA lauroyltransferase/acyltransferase